MNENKDGHEDARNFRRGYRMFRKDEWYRLGAEERKALDKAQEKLDRCECISPFESGMIAGRAMARLEYVSGGGAINPGPNQGFVGAYVGQGVRQGEKFHGAVGTLYKSGHLRTSKAAKALVFKALTNMAGYGDHPK